MWTRRRARKKTVNPLVHRQDQLDVVGVAVAYLGGQVVAEVLDRDLDPSRPRGDRPVDFPPDEARLSVAVIDINRLELGRLADRSAAGVEEAGGQDQVLVLIAVPPSQADRSNRTAPPSTRAARAAKSICWRIVPTPMQA